MLAQMQRPAPKAESPGRARRTGITPRRPANVKSAKVGSPRLAVPPTALQKAACPACRAPALERPGGALQRKAACGCAEGSREHGRCPACEEAARGGVATTGAARLVRPAARAQHLRADGSSAPAERQAEEIGARIGADLSSIGSVTPGPLHPAVQAAAERHLGVSLEGTELRAGGDAHAKAVSEGALAVTEGSTVSFREGHLSATAEGRSLLGHELTHVAQQRAAGMATQQRAFDPTFSVKLPDWNILGAHDKTVSLMPESLLWFPIPIVSYVAAIDSMNFVYVSWLKLAAAADLLIHVDPIWLRDIELRASLFETTVGGTAELSVPMSFTLRVPVLGALVNEWKAVSPGPPKLDVIAAEQVGILGTGYGSLLTQYRNKVDVEVNILTGTISHIEAHEEFDLGVLLEGILHLVVSGHLEDRVRKKTATVCKMERIAGPWPWGKGVRLTSDLDVDLPGGGFSFVPVIKGGELPIEDIIKETGYARKDPACPQVKPLLLALFTSIPEIGPPGPPPGPPGVGPLACPVPINFRQISGSSFADMLFFKYTWDSSTGKLEHLSACEVGEYVTYPGSDPYIWPRPPWRGSNPNPTESWRPGKAGEMNDEHRPKPYVKPYEPATFTAKQYYRYRTRCANNGKPVFMMGPIAITRGVIRRKDDGKFEYVITKSGLTAKAGLP